jgi:hypothetical protein
MTLRERWNVYRQRTKVTSVLLVIALMIIFVLWPWQAAVIINASILVLRARRNAFRHSTYWNRLEKRRLSPFYGIFCTVISVPIVLFLIVMFVILPWHTAVTSNSLIIFIILFTILIFLCSATELAISGTTLKAFIDSQPSLTRDKAPYGLLGGMRVATISFVLAEKENSDRKHDTWANSVIVIINTLCVVLFSVITTAYSHKSAGPMFSVIGVTVVVTLVGEVIPKQIAVKRSLLTLRWAWMWVWILFVLRIFPIVAFGFVWPVEKIDDCFDNK